LRQDSCLEPPPVIRVQRICVRNILVPLYNELYHTTNTYKLTEIGSKI